jgi:ketosteroid isomerase-like protein
MLRAMRTWCSSRIRDLAIAFAVASCGGGNRAETVPSRAQSLDALVRAEHEFARLASDSSVQLAFESRIAQDGILFRPGPVDGRAALAAQPMSEDLALVWEPAWADVSAAGDLGYTTGPWRAGTRGTPRDSLPGAGQYVTLWRRTPEGLRFELDSGVSQDVAGLVWPARVEFAPAAMSPGGAVASNGPASDALLIADQDLADALADGDPVVYRAYAADGVLVLRDGAGPARGVDALIAAAPAIAVRYVPANSVVAASNDLGYTYGAMRLERDAQEVPLGYYLRIWRRQGDGSWKLALDLVSLPRG